jgi:hypothetical protein
MPSVNKLQHLYFVHTSFFYCSVSTLEAECVGSTVYGLATRIMILEFFPTPNLSNKRCYSIRYMSIKAPTSYDASLKYRHTHKGTHTHTDGNVIS